MSISSSTAWFGMTREELCAHLERLAGDIRQPETAPMRVTEIDKWAIAHRAVPCLIGLPSGHPKISDGQPLFTSELYFLDPEQRMARSFSRWYKLGEQVDPAYWEQRYPRPK